MHFLKTQDIIHISRLTGTLPLDITTDLLNLIEDMMEELNNVAARDNQRIHMDQITYLEQRVVDLENDEKAYATRLNNMRNDMANVVSQYFKTINYYNFLFQRSTPAEKLNNRIARIKELRHEFPSLGLKAAKELDEFFYTSDGLATLEGLNLYNLYNASMDGKVNYDFPVANVPNTKPLTGTDHFE